jgi:hypothetical protein
MTGTSNFVGNFVDVVDSAVSDSSSAVTLPLNPASSIDSGNTTGWFGYITGRVFSDLDGTIGLNGATVRLLVNGVDSTYTALTANNAAGGGTDGEFSIATGALVDNNILSFYLDNGADDGILVTRYASTSSTDYDIYVNAITVQTESTGAIDNSDLDTANNGDTDITSLYADGGGSTLTTTAISTLSIRESGAGVTYEYAPVGTLDLNGDFIIQASSGVFASAIAVTSAGDFDNNGVWQHTGTITFDGTSAQTVSMGVSAIGSDIIVSNTTADVTLGATLNTGANDLTVNANATLALSSWPLTATGVFSNNGTVELIGNETVNITQDTNSGLWRYVGITDAVNDAYTLLNFGAVDYYTLEIDAESGDSFVPTTQIAVQATTTVADGTLNFATNSISFLSYGNYIQDGGTFSANGGSILDFGSDFTLNSGTFSAGDVAMEVDDDFIINNGTFNSSSYYLLTRDFYHLGGTFNHNNGSVSLGYSASIFSPLNTVFHGFSITDLVNNASDFTISMASGTSAYIESVLSIDGLDADDMLVLQTTGATSTIYMNSGAVIGAANFLEITNNQIIDVNTGNNAFSTPVNPANSIDGGSTAGWFTTTHTISGTVYTDEGTTNIGAGKTVRVLINGLAAVTDDTDTSGVYSVSVPLMSADDVVTAHIDDETEDGVTVSLSNAADITGFDIYVDHTVIRSETATAVTLAHLNTANDADADIITLYTDGVSPIFQASKELYIVSGDTFTPGGVLDVNGDIEINGGLTLAGNAMTLAGNFLNSAATGVFTTTGTVTLEGTTTQTITSGGDSFTNIVITNTTASVLLGSTLTATGTFTNTAGTVDLLANDLSVTGTFSNTGTMRLRGNQTITLTAGNDTDSGVWEYYGNGIGSATTHTVKDFGATDYYNLIINDTSATNSDTFAMGAALAVVNDLTVTDSIFDSSTFALDVNGNFVNAAAGAFLAPQNTFTLAGNFTNAGTFTGEAASGTVVLDGVNQTITPTVATSFTRLSKTDSTQ